jgi:predicted ATPase/class 3 adenylate cyclase
VTFLFTDIEGSSAAWDLEETAMDLALARHDEILRRAVGEAGGYVFASAGDGLGAAFSRAQQALAAAVSAQRELCAEAWPEPIHLSVRMGMHTGEAVERDGDYFGPAVIRASRLMSAVDGGRIVCSLTTEQLVRGHLPQDVELVPAGTLALKGLSLPEQVFVVRGAGLPDTGQRLEPPPTRGVPPPRALTRLVGRHAELDSIAGQLVEAWLVTLTGVGGVGKSRLAMAVADAVADKFPDGIIWLELAPVSEVDVVQSVADGLGLRAEPGQPLIATVCDALRDLQTLVVLDNCEHLRAAAADLAVTIGQRCARVAVLATSRERLGVEGERAVRVPPLGAAGHDAPAVELLLERIDNPDGLTPDDEATLVEMAQRLEGLPLALELAAARCRSLGVAEVAARLGDRFDLLADRTRRTERHRTLEAAMAWSYDLLTPVEQQVLQRLSAFAGSFTLGGAERVAGLGDLGAVDVDDALASLVDKSLVIHDAHRFRLLEPTRQFATQRLASSGHASEALEAHCCYVADRAGTIRAGLNGPDELQWVNTLDAEWPDVRAAVRHAFDTDHSDALISIIVQLVFEFMFRRPEGFPWVTEAVSRYSERPSPHRHELLGAGALVAFTNLDIAGAVELGEEAMAADPAPGTAISCLPQIASLGAYVFAGNFERALLLAEHTETVLGPGSEPWIAGAVLTSASLAALGQGSLDQAATVAAQAVTQAEASCNASSVAYALGVQALTLAPTDPAAAQALVHRAQAIAAPVRNQWILMLQAPLLGTSTGGSGHDTDRLDANLQAIDTLHHTGRLVHAWMQTWTVVTILFKMGRQEEAALLLGGCKASGTARPPQVSELPDALAALGTGRGDQRLTELYEAGSRLTLPELTQIAAGKQPIPRLTGNSTTPQV